MPTILTIMQLGIAFDPFPTVSLLAGDRIDPRYTPALHTWREAAFLDPMPNRAGVCSLVAAYQEPSTDVYRPGPLGGPASPGLP